MRKIHAVLLAGAVVGVSALAGLAAFAPSLIGLTPTTHEMTIEVPGGGTATVVYAGNFAPKVTFHNRFFASTWPVISQFNWTVPAFAALDPLAADMQAHFDTWVRPPVFLPLIADQPRSMTDSGSPPFATAFSMISRSSGDAFCARSTQITKDTGNAKPKIVSRTFGNCGTSSKVFDTSQRAPMPTMTGSTTVRPM
jgi:hypothetical protein